MQEKKDLSKEARRRHNSEKVLHDITDIISTYMPFAVVYDRDHRSGCSEAENEVCNNCSKQSDAEYGLRKLVSGTAEAEANRIR